MRSKRWFIVLLAATLLALCVAPGLQAEDRTPVDVVFMTTPFGTHMYLAGAAAEQVFKKGAFEGLDQDIMGRAGPNGFLCDESLPDDVVKEILRVWNTHRDDFAKYDAMLGFMPRTPYPVGAEPEDVHPAVISAMEEMDLPIPKMK